VPSALIFAGDPALAQQASERYAAAGGYARGWIRSLEEISRIALGEGDILVVFALPADEDAAVDAVRRARAKAAVVAVDEGPGAGHQVTWYSKGIFRVSFADSDEGWQALTGAILDSAEERAVVLARFYPSLRDVAAQRLIKHAARQNAAIGAAFFIPGTDMPLMTVNQIRMVLNLAVMYGEELSQERAVEILGVIGAGLGFRAVARQFVTVVPGPGWAYKGAMGYSGTIALGHAAIRYFKEGAPATPGHLAGWRSDCAEGPAEPVPTSSRTRPGEWLAASMPRARGRRSAL
jgi:uncharacterized protein (DUF697 family)